MNLLLILLLLQIAFQIECPCENYQNADDCQAFQCFFDEKLQKCREIKCSERSIDDCQDFNTLRRFKDDPILCQLIEKGEGDQECIDFPKSCDLVYPLEGNCQYIFCEFNGQNCSEYPKECIYPKCTQLLHYISTNHNITGFCFPNENNSCQSFSIDMQCKDIYQQEVCHIFANCNWKNNACQDIKCEDRKYGQCYKQYMPDIYHFCVEKEGQCQETVIEELTQFQCKRNSIRQFYNNQCRSCNVQVYQTFNLYNQRWLQKEEFVPNWTEGDNSAFYQDKDDLDDKFVVINSNFKSQSHLFDSMGSKLFFAIFNFILMN